MYDVGTILVVEGTLPLISLWSGAMVTKTPVRFRKSLAFQIISYCGTYHRFVARRYTNSPALHGMWSTNRTCECVVKMMVLQMVFPNIDMSRGVNLYSHGAVK